LLSISLKKNVSKTLPTAQILTWFQILCIVSVKKSVKLGILLLNFANGETELISFSCYDFPMGKGSNKNPIFYPI